MIKGYLRATLAALFILVFMISLASVAFAEVSCPHTETVVHPSGSGKHDIICKKCLYLVCEEDCTSSDSSCGSRPICDVCGVEFGPLPLPHIAADTLSSNAECHYVECINCGEPYPDTEEAHEYGEWFTALSATEESEGERARECVECGYRECEPIPMLEPEDENNGIAFLVASSLFAIALVVGIVLFKKGTLAALFNPKEN